MKSRKGENFWELQWLVIRIPLLALIAVFIVSVSAVYLSESYDVSHLRNLIINERLRIAPDTYMYTDKDTGRLFPGVVEKQSFTQDVMGKSFIYHNNTGARACLVYGGKTECTYINEARYDWWYPLISYQDKYAGTRRKTYSLIHDNAFDKGPVFDKGILDTEVVVLVD